MPKSSDEKRHRVTRMGEGIMSEKSLTVTAKRQIAGELPSWATEGVAIVMRLSERGFLKQVEERLLVHRGGGYAGIDALLHLLYYFTGGQLTGLKKFDGRIWEVRKQLAALGGRTALPTQSSMSRLLRAMMPEVVGAIGRWLLREGAEVTDLFQQPLLDLVAALMIMAEDAQETISTKGGPQLGREVAGAFSGTGQIVVTSPTA